MSAVSAVWKLTGPDPGLWPVPDLSLLAGHTPWLNLKGVDVSHSGIAAEQVTDKLILLWLCRTRWGSPIGYSPAAQRL